MNSPEAQYQLAMKMPEASLANILRGQPGDVDQSVAMMVLRQRQKMKTASQGQQAGEAAQSPSVKDRMLQSQQGQLPENQGIGTLPSPNMGQVATMAQGGVVGFAGGGDVQHFQVGGDAYPSYLTTPEEIAEYEKFRAEQRRLIGERQARGIPGSSYNPPNSSSMGSTREWAEGSPKPKGVNPKAPMGLGSLANAAGAAATIGGLRRGALNAAGMPSSEDAYAYGESRKAGVRQNITDFLASQNRDVRLREAGIDPYPQETEARNPAYQVTGPTTYPQAPTTDVAAAPVSTGRPRGENAPVSDGSIGGVPGAPARTLDEIKQSNSLAGIEALTGAAQPAAGAAQPTAPADSIKALAPVSSFAATQGIMNASTKPYTDEMSKLVKGLNLSAGEKENQKYTRLGNTFLSAAQELLTSGRPGASSIGAAFGKVGTLAQDYAKEDKAERKAAIGAEISMLGAQAQMAQHNTKNAIDMFQHAQKLAFEGIKLRSDEALKTEELSLKRQGLYDEKEFRNKTIQYHNAQIEEQKAWHEAHLPLLKAQAGEATARGGYYGAAGGQNKLMLNAIGQYRRSDEKLASGVGADAKAAKARLSGDGSVYADMARKQLGFETQGLGALEPKSSIQKYTIDPADVFKAD